MPNKVRTYNWFGEQTNEIRSRSGRKENMLRPYQIASLCRQDIVDAFEQTNLRSQARARAWKMTHEEMTDLAEKMEAHYTSKLFGDSLRDIFRKNYLSLRNNSRRS